MKKIKVKLIDNGMMPTYSRDGDACLDCYANEYECVPTGKRNLIKLGFALQLPKGYEAVIRGRSGLARDGIDIAIGTIDSNYRGEVSANVINNSAEDFFINRDDRICQLAIRKANKYKLIEVDSLNNTNRGINGFGSSGV